MGGVVLGKGRGCVKLFLVGRLDLCLLDLYVYVYRYIVICDRLRKWKF